MRLAAPDQAGRKARNLPSLSKVRRGHRSRRIIHLAIDASFFVCLQGTTVPVLD